MCRRSTDAQVGPKGEAQQPTFYLVLEYCDGGDLAGFLHSRKRSGCQGVNEVTTRKLLRQLAMGLKELHKFNIVHVRLPLCQALPVLRTEPQRH